MTYIKNNKIFIFLFSMLLFIAIILSYNLLFPETNSNPTQSTSDQSTTAKINNFYGHFSDDKLAVELSWDISAGNKTIKKIALYCNDEEIADVSNSYSISLSESNYGISTGNNKFDLKVTFTDDTELSKSKYVYTDEAYAIKIAQQNMDTKSVFTVTYYYDKRRPVTVPSVQMSEISENFTMNFVNSTTVREEGNLVEMQIVYELQYNDAKVGNYQVALAFVFSQYNLTKDYTAAFQVVANNDNQDLPDGNDSHE